MMPQKHLRNPTAMTAPNRSIDFEQLKIEKNNNQMETIAEKTSNAELLQFLRSQTGHVPTVSTSKDVWINTQNMQRKKHRQKSQQYRMNLGNKENKVISKPLRFNNYKKVI